MEPITVTVCAGTTCVLMGGSNLLMLEEQLPEHLVGRVKVKGARCLERCDGSHPNEAPYVLIDGELLADATLPRILARLEALAASREG